MLNTKLAMSLMVLFAGSFCAQAESSPETVEVMLVDSLDESRGYCVDIAGGQGKKAPLDKGLQAHTCYHYMGKILEDQEFDVKMIKEGKFFIPYFNVCMSVPSLKQGAALGLSKCIEQNTQKFELKPNGHLVAKMKPNLCVTVNSSEKKEGRGGKPVHVMRPLTLQTCNKNSKDYQTWTLNSL